jgi:hypothetical protein
MNMRIRISGIAIGLIASGCVLNNYQFALDPGQSSTRFERDTGRGPAHPESSTPSRRSSTRDSKRSRV